MEFLSEIPLVGGTLFYLVPFLAVLVIVVFVHEYGHYIVGRWCGIHAETFSIGFGAELFGWHDSRGTRWRVAAIPLGGYVKFLGDAGASSRADQDKLAALAGPDRARSFHHASVGRRTLTVLAGPVANFLLSILVFAGLAMWQGKPSDAAAVGQVEAYTGFQPGDEVLSVAGEPVANFFELIRALDRREGRPAPTEIVRGGERLTIEARSQRPASVDDIAPSGAAAKAGLEIGDTIVAIDGEDVASFRSLQRITRARAGAPMVFTVERDGQRLDFTVIPDIVEREDFDTGEVAPIPTIGVRNLSGSGVGPALDRVGPVEATVYGATRTWGVIAVTFDYLGQIINGQSDASQIGGPLRIAEISGDAADRGPGALITMIAFLSTSIGLLNLFPIPVLDGGHLLFYAVEAVRGRPLKDRWIEVGMAIGLTLVILLMVFATYNDLARL